MLIILRTNSLVIGESQSLTSLLKGSQSRSWITFIECISASGRILEPGIIFKGVDLQSQWFEEEVLSIAPEWNVITTKNGWTNNAVGLKWLEQVFLPQTTPSDDSKARLIIMDGHGSHTTVSIVKFVVFSPLTPGVGGMVEAMLLQQRLLLLFARAHLPRFTAA